ncbi:ORF6C domain-containing protein [Streptococcus parasanguinis]|uniref:ORF6C domain-containing protein n=1 Tax=Streptococcus parasanguinis TaxID=1318 RepID=UPI000778FA97|nr:ORF6C domain-containing protein [Streptococcus parasanguinis]
MMNEVEKVNQDLTTEDVMIHALQELKKLKEGQSVLSADVDYLKNEQPVNPSICLALEKIRKQKVVSLLGGKDSQAYRDRHFAQSVFSQAAKDFKDYFRIPQYDLLKRKDEERAFDYWNNWEPSANTKLEIKARNGQMSLVG